MNVHISSGHPSPTDGAVGVDPVKLYAVFRQSALYSRLARALQSEHPCEDNACDIGAAIEHETPLWGAHILSGATETSQEFDKEYLDIAGEYAEAVSTWSDYQMNGGLEELVVYGLDDVVTYLGVDLDLINSLKEDV